MNLIFVNLTLVADGRMAIPVGFFPISSQTWGFGVTVGKKCQENVKTPWIGLVVFLMQICKKYIFVKKKWSGSINNPKKGNFIKSLKNALHPWKIQTHEKSIPRHHVRNSRPQKKKKHGHGCSHGCITNLRLSRPQIFFGFMDDYNRFTWCYKSSPTR